MGSERNLARLQKRCQKQETAKHPPSYSSMAQSLQSWLAQHPGVEIAGEGRWLVFKPCLNKARRFQSYFAAHRAVVSHEVCRCDDSHFIVELAEVPTRISRSFQAMVESA
jgi:hypothetical protein